MVKWTLSLGCRAHVHCVACRQDADWRASLLAAGLVVERDFDCPHGIDSKTALSEQTRALVALAKTPQELTAIGKGLRQTSKSCCGNPNEAEPEET